MTLTFYYAPMSTAEVTNIVLAELGIPHERKIVDLKAGDTRAPEFLKLNPNGLVPVIVHNGTPIWESSAITMYLGETFGVEKGLWPAPGPSRGPAMAWVTWTHATLGPVVQHWFRNTSDRVPQELRNAKAAEAARAEVMQRFAILDKALADRPFLLGEYTLADTHVSAGVGWLRMSSLDFSPFTHLNDWAKRCTDRPAYQAAMRHRQ